MCSSLFVRDRQLEGAPCCARAGGQLKRSAIASAATTLDRTRTHHGQICAICHFLPSGQAPGPLRCDRDRLGVGASVPAFAGRRRVDGHCGAVPHAIAASAPLRLSDRGIEGAKPSYPTTDLTATIRQSQRIELRVRPHEDPAPAGGRDHNRGERCRQVWTTRDVVILVIPGRLPSGRSAPSSRVRTGSGVSRCPGSTARRADGATTLPRTAAAGTWRRGAKAVAPTSGSGTMSRRRDLVDVLASHAASAGPTYSVCGVTARAPDRIGASRLNPHTAA